MDGLFQVIRSHLARGGLAILNAFCPLYPQEEMVLKWPQKGEILRAEATLPDGDVVRMHDMRERLDTEKQVLHPELIYRRHRGDALVDTHVNPICMCYYYPAEFKARITSQGFTLRGEWGGYDGQRYGEGPELVVAFS